MLNYVQLVRVVVFIFTFSVQKREDRQGNIKWLNLKLKYAYLIKNISTIMFRFYFFIRKNYFEWIDEITRVRPDIQFDRIYGWMVLMSFYIKD